MSAPTVDRSELGALDAVETASRIRAGELSGSEVVAAAVKRAESLGDGLNAVPWQCYEAALERAKHPAPGVFSGVPTFVKNLEEVAGQPNDWGSRAFRGRVARRTDPIMAALLATGLVSLGRSAAPEIGLNATTEPLAYGPTRNPWNIEHSTGGSSGGAAALVAARVVPIASASDAGGSIRIPASCCGLVGLKPSRGRGFEPVANRVLPVPVVTEGVVTRSVRDTAWLLEAMEAAMPSRKLPPIGRIEGPRSERLRIGVYVESPLGEPIDEEVEATTLAAASHCENLGHRIERIACPYPASVVDDTWIHIGFIAWGFRQQVRFARRDASLLEPWTLALADLWQAHWLETIGVARRLRATRQVSARLFERFDALLCPTLGTLPPRLGQLAPDQAFDEVLQRQKRFIPFTPIQNANGDTAISLPLGVSQSGLPIGAQFAARPGGESTLLALAYELEAAGAFRMLDAGP